MVVAALQEAPNPALVKLIALGNLGWVAASFAVVATFAAQMTGLGIVVVVAQAFAVLGFAILEWKGAGAGGQAVAVYISLSLTGAEDDEAIKSDAVPPRTVSLRPHKRIVGRRHVGRAAG